MTVKELISRLDFFNEEATVYLSASIESPDVPVTEVLDDVTEDGPVVTIFSRKQD